MCWLECHVCEGIEKKSLYKWVRISEQGKLYKALWVLKWSRKARYKTQSFYHLPQKPTTYKRTANAQKTVHFKKALTLYLQ